MSSVQNPLLRLGTEEFSNLFAVSAGVNRAKNLKLAARWALENQQQQLNAKRRSNAGSGRANHEVWLGLNGLGRLGVRDASNRKA
jgi:hypothetical protein